MIPLRIAVKGFLCYREEQEIDFETASLWMLAGLNGSGKSAVFDGVTYALFGGHRAGKEHAEELINKNCDSATVEFDFLLDGDRYQARRTLRRKKQGGAAPTQQIARWRLPEEGEPGRWEAVPDTNNKRPFDAWVRENIGLTYETFTSSVLLMQGKAEKLLAAAPKERFEVLAGIVDLERYQRLHERADERRRRLKEQVDVVQVRLDELPEVTAAEMEQAEQRIVAARQQVEKGQAEIEQVQRLELLAERWQGLQARLAATRKHWQRAEGLLAEADAIERATARLAELRDVLPHIATILDQRQRLRQSRETSEVLAAEQRDLARRKGKVATALEQTRQKQYSLQQAVKADQQRAELVAQRLRELSGLAARVALCEQQRRELERVEAALAELPADLAGVVAQVRREHERLQLLGQGLPLLTRLANVRQELHQARQLHTGLIGDEKKATAEVEPQTVECARVAAELERASEARRKADDGAIQARTLLEEAYRQREQIDELSGAKVCRLCGQELTPGHVGEERSKREKIRIAAEITARETVEAQLRAVESEKQARLAKDQADQKLAAIRERVQESRRRQAEAERARQRHTQECDRICEGLPEPLRLRIGLTPPDDWLDSVYPSDNDLTAARTEVERKPAVCKRLQEALAAHERFMLLQADREATLRALKLQEADLPGDEAAVREELQQHETEDVTLKAKLKVARAQVEAEGQALERLHREHQTLGERFADKAQLWSAEEARREECQKALDRARSALPATWQPAATATASDLEAWRAEQRDLEGKNLTARMDELAKARAGTASLRERLQELEAEGKQIPEEARTDPVQLRAQRQALRETQTECEAELLRRERTRERLAERHEKREELQGKHAELDRQHNRSSQLAELLGRTRLQLYLVRQAERGIVDYANAVLDRLSGGQLYLRLRGDETAESGADQALQLEAYNRVTGQAPIGVSFLSGSQRFRVAVSLALGIGQYASRQHRPIESVIIDEGFGCLDRQGRQVMIQELQNLRGQLRCILLVSHQEEFAEAFADVYRFELTDGQTQVTRAQR